MDLRRRKRQISLFLAAILIPAGLLITLAVRVVRQEAELTAKRAADDRRDALDQLRRELSARLQAIKLQEVNRLLSQSGSGLAPDSRVVFIAPIEQDRLVFPWEDRRKPRHPVEQFVRE